MKKFVTLFPHLYKFHLAKDVGMIPESMAIYEGYMSQIATFAVDDYSKNNCTKHLEVVVMEKNEKLISDNYEIFRFLKKHIREYDVLNIYHLSNSRIIIALISKALFNPDTKLYLKLDLDLRMYNDYYLIENIFKQKFRKFLLSKCDLISAESKEMTNKINELYQCDCKYVPDGIDDKIFRYCGEEKENIVLFVGRIGAKQKNTVDLIKGFLEFSKTHQNWKLLMAGSVEMDFWEQYNKIVKDYSIVNIEFCGEINERELLAKLYKKSKIFLFPSLYESFGIALLEACACGCIPITYKEVLSIYDIVEVRSHCVVLEHCDSDSICEGLEYAIQNIEMTGDLYYSISQYAISNFNWKSIAGQIEGALK